MSMIQQLIAAVVNAERQIDDQIVKLNDYVREINNVTQRTAYAFQGSQREYGQQMMQQLSQTKQQVSQTIEHLQAAKEKLTQMRMI